jgi:5-methylcytosine-specific restriction endonuclease McrA
LKLARWWVSWNETSADYRPLHDPPYAAILGWWCSGEAGDGSYFTICALVSAPTEEKAKAAIKKDWPTLHPDWRFVNKMAQGWLPDDRFPITKEWSQQRLGKDKPLRDRKKAQRRSKADETHAIRLQAFSRSGGSCECGCGRTISFASGELDHFHGKGKVKQALSNVWALTRDCHVAKTNSKPDARWWLEAFIQHCGRHGYKAEAEKAKARLESMVLVRETERIRRGMKP